MGVPGYHGRYLRIDLTTGENQEVEIEDRVLRRFIGGTGLGVWLLLRHCPDHVDPLSPESPLIFVFSPLVGSPLTTSAKFAVLSKSPLTGRINDSLSSSSFALSGKKSGFDAIVLTGRREDMSVVTIDDGDVRFSDASHLRGLSSRLTEKQLSTEFGSDCRFASIGPAGENLVSYATISNEGRHAGRGGLGAVMGSKNLKSIAVRGSQRTEFAYPDDLTAYSRELSRKSFGPATEKYRELGTVSNLLTFNRLGTLPTRNFQAGSFTEAHAISPEVVSESHKRTRASCAACTIGCEHIFQLKDRSHPADEKTPGVRMEYENLFALGPLCGISDPDVVQKASRLCDELGVDTISAGGTIAFAMECAERGLIEEPALRFGNADALLSTLNLISSKKGLGALLAQGSRVASIEIGQGSEDFAPHVKGMEIPGYEPRALQTMALGFAVGTRGADHNRSGAYQVDFSDQVDRLAIDERAVPLAIETEDESTLMDSLILCKFLRGVFDDRIAAMGEMLRLVTGFELTSSELRENAGQIITARKLFNLRQGWTPEEDILPKRFLAEPLSTGASEGALLDREQLQKLVRVYNTQRGWQPDGTLGVDVEQSISAVCSAH